MSSLTIVPKNGETVVIVCESSDMSVTHENGKIIVTVGNPPSDTICDYAHSSSPVSNSECEFDTLDTPPNTEIGRASCRERVCGAV